jgi:DNA-binding beta-propeller fold protein YncE
MIKRVLKPFRRIFAILLILILTSIFMAGCVHKPESKEERPDYNNRTSWGKGEFAYIIKGIYDEDLGLPVAACQDFKGNIYVLDLYSTDGLIKVFDNRGKFLYKLAPQQSPESEPVDVVVDSEQNIYVADIGVNAIFKFKQNDDAPEKIQPEEAFFPRSLALDSKDNLIVMSFDKVYKIASDNSLFHFGKSGEGEGEFGAAGSEFYVGPTGIDTDSSDNIYVADTLNSRIQKFRPNGDYITAYNLDIADSPQEIAVNNKGEVYVVTSSGYLIKFDQKANIVEKTDLDESENGASYGLSKGINGNILLVSSRERMVKLISCDEEILSIKNTNNNNFIYPNNLTVFDDRIVIVSGDVFSYSDLNNKVLMYDKTGKFISEFFPGHKDSKFFGPKDVAFYKGRLFLLDLDMIYVFDKGTNFISSFGKRGHLPGEFGVLDYYGQDQGPLSLAISPDGNILVSDTFNDRIQKISKDGRFRDSFEVGYPGAIDVDKKGNIYIVLPVKGKVEKYSPSGERLLSFGKPGSGDGEFKIPFNGDILGPNGIAVDDENKLIYVSDTAAHRIQVFDENGKFIKSLGSFGTKNGFYYPKGLELDDKGFLWVADSENHRVVVINP